MPYKPGSKSAKILAEELGLLRLKARGSKFRARETDTIINWGMSVIPEGFHAARVVNQPEAVSVAANKLQFFKALQDTEVAPEFWTNQDDIPEGAYPVVARTILNGHSGAGIEILEDASVRVYAPLYVKYIKKQEEYRIHVAGGEVIGTQRKARRYDTPDTEVNWQIRNHANGFVFARGNVDPPENVVRVATETVETLGLDFGAVDVVWNAHHSKAYALEVNTAPGLEGSTVGEYAEYFRALQG